MGTRYTYESDELYHYGVLGMKWGVRKKRESADPNSVRGVANTYKSSKKVFNKEFNKAYMKYETSLPFTKRRKSAYNEMEAAGSKFKAAKEKYKKDVVTAKKSAVKEYDKKYEEVVRAQDIADSKDKIAKERYKELGKNKVSRILNAARGKSDAAKRYNKAMDEAINAQDIADAKWAEAKKSYINTGRNRVERLISNIKYGN